MPSSARRIMFSISGALRRIRTIVPRADEGIGPYIGFFASPANSNLLSKTDMQIISYLISYISYLTSYISCRARERSLPPFAFSHRTLSR